MPHSASRRRRPTWVALLAAIVLVVGACGSSTPELSDPVEILQAGAASLGEMDTAHVRGVVEGELPLDIGGAGGGAPLPLDGTTLDGDLDAAGGGLAIELLAPALLNLRLNLVAVDGALYLKAPILTGEKWIRQDVGSADGGDGIDPSALLAGLGDALANPELAPEKLADVRCAGTDCYSVRFTVPAAAIGTALGGLGAVLDGLGGAIPGLSADAVGDVTVTAGIRKDNRQLATLALEVPGGGTEPLSISLELSKVNEPVTIEAPPSDEVTDAPGGIFGG